MDDNGSPMPDDYAPMPRRQDNAWVISEVIDGQEFGVMKMTEDLSDRDLHKLRRAMWSIKEAKRLRKEWNAHQEFEP